MIGFTPVEIECSGAGRCHGPQLWCDLCGDTTNQCDEIECDVHGRSQHAETCAVLQGWGILGRARCTCGLTPGKPRA